MRYNPNDLSHLREAAMHQISEDAQPFENLIEQDARDSSSRVDVTFVADADQRSYENITRDPALKKLPGFLGLGKTIFRPRKGKAEFTFRAANKLSKVGMNKKDEEKFKKLLKKHGLKLVDTIYEGSKKLDEGKKKPISTRLGDAHDSGELEDRIKNLSGPAKRSLTNLANSLLDFYHTTKDIHELDGRELEDKIDASPPRVRKMFAKLLDESVHLDEGYEMRGLGSKGLRNTKVSKKVNAEKVREILTSARIPHSMVMGTIRVPERFVKLAKKKLDNAFGGMFQKKTGFKISGTLKEDVQLDEAIAARDIQGMIKGLNKKAKQEIADVLNDMNLSGYGDYEARADNVHKFKPKDLLKAMNKVMKLEEKKLPTARKIVSGLGDADGPFTVVVMKNKKVIHQESTKFAKMLPAIVKELAEKMPNTTIAIENKTGQIVKVFK